MDPIDLKVTPKTYQITMTLTEKDFEAFLNGLHSIFENHRATSDGEKVAMVIHDTLARLADGK